MRRLFLTTIALFAALCGAAFAARCEGAIMATEGSSFIEDGACDMSLPSGGGDDSTPVDDRQDQAPVRLSDYANEGGCSGAGTSVVTGPASAGYVAGTTPQSIPEPEPSGVLRQEDTMSRVDPVPDGLLDPPKEGSLDR